MIRVRYFAAAAERTGCVEDDVDAAAITIAALRELLAARHPTLGPVLAQSRLAINLRFAKDTDVVDEGSEVAVIPPVGGG
ncbi:MAG: MoaD/ThiS family protein [Deltaproteobacteria bacterium]|nr:MoaD/ThiS family protein [Deltaproteobacteria bacterium]